MATIHPLDHTVWSALTGRQSPLAIVQGGARRYAPAFGVFAATAGDGAEDQADLARLVAAHGDVALLEPSTPPVPTGVAIHAQDLGVQMTASRLTPGPRCEVVPLTDADAAEMLALATLTVPGPFFARTHELGDFFGVKEDGRLVAMAGERMKPDGFTEVSGVCTHPDRRGRGYAGALTRAVAERILERGETPFLHAYAVNTAAIALYESFGFTRRREVLMTRLTCSA